MEFAEGGKTGDPGSGVDMSGGKYLGQASPSPEFHKAKQYNPCLVDCPVRDKRIINNDNTLLLIAGLEMFLAVKPLLGD